MYAVVALGTRDSPHPVEQGEGGQSEVTQSEAAEEIEGAQAEVGQETQAREKALNLPSGDYARLQVSIPWFRRFLSRRRFCLGRVRALPAAWLARPAAWPSLTSSST